MESNQTAMSKMASILIPVVVGSLLGLLASIATSYYTFHVERSETIRKEGLAHRERAMTLAVRYSNDVGKLLGIGFLTNGDVAPSDLAVLAAPTETLMELNVVVSLYFPHLKHEVDQLLVAHGSMMQRFDEITGSWNEDGQEGATLFSQRIQREVAPAIERVHSLMKQLSEPPDS